MKRIIVLLCIIFAGCAATNEDLAKGLIKERLKTSLPDFNSYESISFSAFSTAFLPYEETDQYLQNSKSLRGFKDSASILQTMIAAKGVTAATDSTYAKNLQQMTDSAKLRDEVIRTAKRGYTPPKLFKMTHSFKAKDASGIESVNKVEYYFDKDFKAIMKETG